MSKRYVVTGIIGKSDNGTGRTVYMGIDHHSGGYPYWTDYPKNAATYESVDRALSGLSDYMFREARDVKVCTIEYVTTPVHDVTPDLTLLQDKLTQARRLLETTTLSLQEAITCKNSYDIAKYSGMIGGQGEMIRQLENQLNAITN